MAIRTYSAGSGNALLSVSTLLVLLFRCFCEQTMKHRHAVLLLLLIPSIAYAQTVTPAPAENQAKVTNIAERVKGRLRVLMATENFPGAEVGFVYVDGQTADGKPRFVSGSVAIGVSDLET